MKRRGLFYIESHVTHSYRTVTSAVFPKCPDPKPRGDFSPWYQQDSNKIYMNTPHGVNPKKKDVFVTQPLHDR